MKSKSKTKQEIDYWGLREYMMLLIERSDQDGLEEFKAEYPDIFQNVFNQAKNALNARNG